MSTERHLGGRQIWTVAAWLAVAALAATGIVLNDVSLAIGAGVAAIWALRFRFFPADGC